MRPLSNLQFSVQGLSRTAGEGSPGNIRLDYGFIDYTFSNQENSQFGIRLGRMKNPLGFYNDTRDVPFTRPSILLPQSIYFDRTRKLPSPRMARTYMGNTGPITATFPSRRASYVRSSRERKPKRPCLTGPAPGSSDSEHVLRWPGQL